MKNKTKRLAGSLIAVLFAAGGELYFRRQHNEEMAVTLLFLGLLAIVAVDKVIELFGKDSEDVLAELLRLQHQIGAYSLGPEALRVLERLRGKPLHHYHLTKSRSGDPMWSYKVIRFGDPPSGGKLTATVSFLPNAGASAKDHTYEIEASLDRSHLIMRTRRLDGSPDIGIEVFRDFVNRSSASAFPLYGAKILTTWWDDQLASSISILSDTPLVRGAGDGVPMTNPGTLQVDWERRSGIARLPPAVPLLAASDSRPSKQGVTLDDKWDEDKITELLQDSPVDADIRIFISFFVTDVDLFELIGRLLTRSRRKVTIMMLDPESPVLEMRYGTEERKIRESITATSARAKISSQLHDLTELGKMLKRRANDAVRENRREDLETLEVRLYDCAPTLVSYYTQEKMLVGMLFLHKSVSAGPMIEVQRGEPLWELIEGNWETILRLSKDHLGAGNRGADWC